MKKLTEEEKKKCAKVMLNSIIDRIEDIDDVVYERLPEEIGDDEKKMKLVIDEFNVESMTKIVRDAFEAKYGNIEG